MSIAGGNWNNAANAGVFNVNLNNPRTNSNFNIGFRSALLSYARIGWFKNHQTVRENKGACFRSGPADGRRKIPSLVRGRRVRLWRHTKQEATMETASSIYANAATHGKTEERQKIEDQKCF